MVIMCKPKNETNYISVDSEGCKILHKLGFQPIYKWNGNIYFTKSDEIVEVIKNCNLRIK